MLLNNVFSELSYLFSSNKNENKLRKILRKNPKWSKGHLLLSKLSKSEDVREVSKKALKLIKSN